MKAAFLVKNGKASTALEVRETNDPQIEAHQLLIRVEAFGLNFADVMARLGLYPDAPEMPCVLGYEVVGKVEEVGKDVDNSLIGKRVVAMTRFGGYAELAVADHRALAVVDEELEAAKAVALATQYITAWYAGCEMMNLRKGQRVLIHAAAGGVGTALTQIAKWRGCEVFGNAGSEEKIEYLKKQGVDHPINYRKLDYENVVRERLGSDKRLDATFNPIAGSTFKKDMRLLGHGGRLALYGASDRVGGSKFWKTLKMVYQMGLIMPISLVGSSKSVIGINMLRIADTDPEMIGHCLGQVVRLQKEGILDPTVGGEYEIDDLAKAHELLENRETIGKVAVKW
ncbi:zinc-binding dehydrogenase [Halocola ammonii]